MNHHGSHPAATPRDPPDANSGIQVWDELKPPIINAAFVYSLEESGTCQLYSPDRATRIEWAL